jgi:hypothetical protein
VDAYWDSILEINAPEHAVKILENHLQIKLRVKKDLLKINLKKKTPNNIQEGFAKQLLSGI